MMFLAFALLSGIALFASARPSGVSGRGVTTHKINVSNDSAALLFDPPYIVRQPISLYAGRCADCLSPFQNAYVGDIVEFTFHPKNHSVTQSSFNAPCTPLKGGFDTGLCVPEFSHRMFFVSDASPHHTATLLHLGPVTGNSPHGNSPSTMYVCSLAKYGSYQGLAILIFLFLFLLDEPHLDTL